MNQTYNIEELVNQYLKELSKKRYIKKEETESVDYNLLIQTMIINYYKASLLRLIDDYCKKSYRGTKTLNNRFNSLCRTTNNNSHYNNFDEIKNYVYKRCKELKENK